MSLVAAVVGTLIGTAVPGEQVLPYFPEAAAVVAVAARREYTKERRRAVHFRKATVRKPSVRRGKRMSARDRLHRRIRRFAPRWYEVADTTLAIGVRYQRYRVVASPERRVHVIRVWLRQPGVEVKLIPALPGQRETLADIVRRYDTSSPLYEVVAAVNGYFWSRWGAFPVGIAATDGELLQASRYKRWSAFAVDGRGNAFVDTFLLQLAVRLPDGCRLPLHSVNRRDDTVSNVLYTRFAGDTIPRPQAVVMTVVEGDSLDSVAVVNIPADTLEPLHWKLRLRYLRTPFLGGSLPCLVVGVDSGSVPMPLRGCLLSLGRPFSLAALPQVGDTVWLESTFSPSVKSSVQHVWSGTPRLVRNGRVQVEAAREGTTSARFLYRRRARTAVGLTRRGELLLVVVEHGHSSGGATIAELAQWMRHLGAYQALNLDGGSSSGVYIPGVGTLGNTFPVASALAVICRKMPASGGLR